MNLKFKNVIVEHMFKKHFMAFNPMTTKYDDTFLSPNYSFFFARPLNSAKDMPALLLGGVTDFEYDSSFDTDDTQSRGFNQRGIAGMKNETVRTGWTGSLDFTTLEMVNVEAQQMLYAIHESGDPVEIWEVHADRIAGIGLVDTDGTQVIEGRFADRYYVGRVDEADYSNNAGDDNITYDWTINLLMMPDTSWVDPFPVETAGLAKAVNRSLQKYDEETDIPDHTQRDRYSDDYGYSGDTSQVLNATPNNESVSTE
jgi:hypothetical protein